MRKKKVADPTADKQKMYGMVTISPVVIDRVLHWRVATTVTDYDGNDLRVDLSTYNAIVVSGRADAWAAARKRAIEVAKVNILDGCTVRVSKLGKVDEYSDLAFASRGA
jgi:hypothetical protein